MKKVLLILWCLFRIFDSSGNVKNYCFTIIDGESGLSQNNVKAVMQDSWGFMWFGGRNRLNRYDGISIKVFDCHDPVSNKRNNNISTLYEDKDRQLWVGTDNGIFIFDPVTEKFSFLDIMTPEGIIIEDWVADIRADQNDNIWIIIPNQGLFRYQPSGKQLFCYRLGDSRRPDKGTPQSICIEPNGKVWVGTNGQGIFLYNRLSDAFIQYLGDKNGSSLKGENIYTLCDYGDELLVGIHEGKLKKMHKRKNTLSDVDAPDVHYKIIRHIVCFGNDIWVGTQSGLYVINELDNSTTHIHEDPMFAHALSDNVIEKIYKDNEGGIWIATNYGGVNYLPNRGTIFEQYLPTSATGSISSKRIGELGEDHNGNIWVATEDAGVNIFDPKSRTFKVIGRETGSSLSHYKALSLLLDKQHVWVGFFKNGLDIVQLPSFHIRHYSQEQLGLNEASIFALCEDRNSTIWLGNAWGVYTGTKENMKFERSNVFGFSFIYDILEDSEGYIWVATIGNGVFRHHPANNTTEHFLHRINDSTSLSSNSVSSITEDHKGNIWFATDRGGICVYDKKTRKFISYSIGNGLPDDVAYKILEDDYRNLWFGTNKGLVRFNPQTKDIRVFTKNDGLPGNQFNYKSALASGSGKFYFGGLNGLIAFDPYHYRENKYMPPVFISRMTIFNHEIGTGEDSPLEKSITHTKKIILTHNQANVGFDFVALSYTAPLANKYAYKMEGIDKDWTYTTNNHSASYARLPPGRYTFRVKGSNNDGVWNESGTFIDIEILPPWWRSAMACFIYIIAAITSSYLLIHRYQFKINKRNAEKQKLFETEKEKELYSAKLEFFTDIAHEIRTPLTLINGPLERMLEMKVADPEIEKNLNIMSKNTSRLLKLINELLNFRKVDSNKLTLSFSMVNITDAITDIATQFETILTRQGKQLQLHLPDIPLIAPVDKGEFSKILNNLFSNAEKYSDKLIHVSLKINPQSFLIIIENDGELIPETQGEKIFEPFYRLRKDKHSASSSGIGLSLVRSLTELHHGSIRLNTRTGMNCFTLELPLEQENVIDVKNTDAVLPDSLSDSHGLKQNKPHQETVLIVEDNMEMLPFIADQLQDCFEVEKAASGHEAIRILHEKNIDIIVSDVMMPDMDGFELCRNLKSEIEFSHIPIVLLTARNDMTSKIQGLEAGAEAYIEKPFSPNYLVTQLTTLLNNRKREREAFKQKPFLAVQQISMNKSDEKFMNRTIEIIRDNITDADLNVEKLAEILCMSRSSLHRKIKALTELAPIDFIRLIRLKKAAELIQEGEYRIGEICYLVGINSPSYFIKLFQKQFGMTPKEFEKQH